MCIRDRAPILEPKYGRLLLRYEGDTQRLFIPIKELRKELERDETDYNAFLEDLKKRGVYIKTDNKRLSKGMTISTPAQRCAIFDTSHSEFFDISKLVEKAKGDEDREGELSD